MGVVDVNFDGLVGPTHNYAGLSWGNVASISNKLTISNPREAALQGLSKMKFLMNLGLPQAVLPPHERPHIPTLCDWGTAVKTSRSSSRLPVSNRCCWHRAQRLVNVGRKCGDDFTRRRYR